MKYLEQSGRGLFEWYPLTFTYRLERNTKISVKIASIPAEIRTENLPNKSLVSYRHASLLSATL
jgi:hypothetical protein